MRVKSENAEKYGSNEVQPKAVGVNFSDVKGVSFLQLHDSPSHFLKSFL